MVSHHVRFGGDSQLLHCVVFVHEMVKVCDYSSLPHTVFILDDAYAIG